MIPWTASIWEAKPDEHGDAKLEGFDRLPDNTQWYFALADAFSLNSNRERMLSQCWTTVTVHSEGLLISESAVLHI